MQLNELEEERYKKCLGQCRICLLNGDCKLQTKLENEVKRLKGGKYEILLLV